MEEVGGPFVVPGLGASMVALGKIGRWSERIRELDADSAPAPNPAVPAPAERSGTWSEDAARGLLENAGVPVIPATLTISADQAVDVAAAFGGPVAIKIVSPEILHKSDIGGVRLGVEGEIAVREAFAAVTAAADLVPDANVEGVLISPMRSPATELLVGVVRDPQWGPMLAVALGGIFVEVLGDSSLSTLPVTHSQARAMLTNLRGAAILSGVRGGKAADLDVLADVVTKVADLAVALGDELLSLEVNPLRVDGDQVEALDAVVEWVSK
jgi:acyl-CoA synthetase (NDP forming)